MSKTSKPEADKIIDVVVNSEKMKWNVTKWGEPPDQTPKTPRNEAHAKKAEEQKA